MSWSSRPSQCTLLQMLTSQSGTLSPDDSRAEHDRSTRVFQTSDFDLFRDLKGVVDLNAEISHCAFNFLVPKK